MVDSARVRPFGKFDGHDLNKMQHRTRPHACVDHGKTTNRRGRLRHSSLAGHNLQTYEMHIQVLCASAKQTRRCHDKRSPKCQTVHPARFNLGSQPCHNTSLKASKSCNLAILHVLRQFVIIIAVLGDSAGSLFAIKS